MLQDLRLQVTALNYRRVLLFNLHRGDFLCTGLVGGEGGVAGARGGGGASVNVPI